ncbi:tetratricopeptide repeat protein [Flavobacterium sp. ANB]|uniref:tetratricopeptide repeat protein n=1 Tax=unclassified Flavobacterium TaxID=196869 RepID=UPI0012B8AAE1|nr:MULTISPECIES: tetratricopeptide repeat protein [unclassified Flavobacterium]MBF4516828.1 tetratricopeptide repeat protein [Flavobacterium sp. ANB]MTD69276.1 tetratricopeptide repeat protein [Flavobacterium sp. LC2016-13]
MKLNFLAFFLILALGNNVNAQNISIQVLSAVEKDKVLDNAEVMIQRNGESSTKRLTNTQGKTTINGNFQDDSNTLLIIKKDNYSTLVVKCPCNDLTYALSPVMKNLDGMRIVLNWGKYPSDLDSHLSFPGNHIYFEHKKGSFSNLDVDDTDSYGPETITINNKKFGQTYHYFVHDYSNRDDLNASQLSASGAKVFVYVGQSLVKTYYIPKNKKGNVWNLFKINENGEIIDINNIISKTEQEVGIVGSSGDGNEEEVYVSNEDKKTALLLNKKGDLAYQDKDVDAALNFYKQAIEYNPVFGQAYGNLGLMYIKKGYKAEAIYSNRKAITYAAGNSINTTKASAYYNIAKIFENDNDFEEALNYYKLAKEYKENTVYDNAIIRVESKLRG